MSKSNAFENGLLQLVYQNVDFAGVGDAGGLRGSATAGSLYVSLHTADPGEAGTQATNEISYTGYARVAVARNATNFPVSGGAVSFAANVDFGKRTNSGGSLSATHFAIGVASSGATMVLHKGTITPAITVAEGTIPRCESGQFAAED